MLRRLWGWLTKSGRASSRPAVPSVETHGPGRLGVVEVITRDYPRIRKFIVRGPRTPHDACAATGIRPGAGNPDLPGWSVREVEARPMDSASLWSVRVEHERRDDAEAESAEA